MLFDLSEAGLKMSSEWTSTGFSSLFIIKGIVENFEKYMEKINGP